MEITLENKLASSILQPAKELTTELLIEVTAKRLSGMTNRDYVGSSVQKGHDVPSHGRMHQKFISAV